MSTTTRTVLVVLDLVGLDAATCDVIKSEIAAIKLKGLERTPCTQSHTYTHTFTRNRPDLRAGKLSLAPSDVLLACTHTHTGPQTHARSVLQYSG